MLATAFCAKEISPVATGHLVHWSLFQFLKSPGILSRLTLLSSYQKLNGRTIVFVSLLTSLRKWFISYLVEKIFLQRILQSSCDVALA